MKMITTMIVTMKKIFPLIIMLAFCCGSVAAKKVKESKESAVLRSKTEPYLKKVQAQPDWLYSRLQMYWKTHATDVYVNGETFDHAGGDSAMYATVKYNGTRGTATQYNRPRLEDVVPYDDDAEGNVTFINSATGNMEKAHPSKTGCNIASLNRQILGIARNAARIYAATGEKDYGKMAADVFITFMRGIYCRNVPYDLNHGHQQTLVGLTTFEVIHEDAIKELTETYPLIRPLLSQDDIAVVDAAFKKWAENIIACGVPHNNWNLLQADFIMRIALVLGDDKNYADAKGKDYYLDYIVNRNSIRQWSVGRLLDYGFGGNKIWYESPGYSMMVVGEFCQFANSFDEKAGIDLFARYPVLIEATKTMPEYLFPNRMIAGFGDTHPGYLSTMALDNITKYAVRHNDKSLQLQMAALKQAVAPTASVEEIEQHVSQVVYAPNVSWLAMRTGMDSQHDLMASLNASLGNHQHANGISLELYGKGYVLGPDAGIGRNLYSGLDYAEYYSQMPAHNTVVVDGISSYPVMMSNHAFKVVGSSPEVSPQQPFSSRVSEQKAPLTYATVSFLEPETQALQQRTTAIVKTSAKGGYYIDVFRSRKQEGGDKTHDYFYHNLGQKMSVTSFDGKALDMQPTEELAFAGGHLGAYSYIYDKVSATTDKNVKVVFTTKIEDEKVATALHGQHEITMTMWMKGDSLRTFFQALSPANLEYERMPLQPYKVESQPVLTFVARQSGEAWSHPFVAVFEPESDTEPGDILSVDYFTPEEKNSVGIIVTLKDGTMQRITCTEDGRCILRQ